MFCENCGNKLKENHKFCTGCGHSNSSELSHKKESIFSDEKWWHRLAKVIYIGLYLPLPVALIAVWSENSQSCVSSFYPTYSRTCTDTLGEAFLLTLLTLVAWVVVLRLMKIIFLYITLARKPQWKKEFKKFF